MEALNLIDSFSEFKESKNIDRETMMHILEDVLRGTLKRNFGTDENCDIIINIDKGDLEMWRNREIVEDKNLDDPSLQIAYTDAIKIEPDFEVGEEVSEEIKLVDFGRRLIASLRQNLIARIIELEKDGLYNKYKDRVGAIISGEVYQIWKRESLIIDDEGNELVLPKNEQISSDYFKKGDSVRAIILKIT